MDFTVALPPPGKAGAIDLGEVIDCGRRQPGNRVRLDRADLDKHCFITGVTGAGKTTTCLNLLIDRRPFLVIEPAKTEYRALHARLSGEVDYYRPNGDPHRSLRLNPFALLHPGRSSGVMPPSCATCWRPSSRWWKPRCPICSNRPSCAPTRPRAGTSPTTPACWPTTRSTFTA